jgi:hypothetical protein
MLLGQGLRDIAMSVSTTIITFVVNQSITVALIFCPLAAPLVLSTLLSTSHPPRVVFHFSVRQTEALPKLAIRGTWTGASSNNSNK